MPAVFLEKMPFENKTKFDTPLWTDSLSIFEVAVDANPRLIINQNSINFCGFVPFANTLVSNESKYPALRRKTFLPTIAAGIVADYRVNTAWKHKAIYTFSYNFFTDPSFSFIISDNSNVTMKPGAKDLISVGKYREHEAAFMNPLHKAKKFSVINIHRGPKRNYGDGNMSLGCVTVEQTQFDIMMKQIPYYNLVVYIHKIDELVSNSEHKGYNCVGGLDHEFVSKIYGTINAHVAALGGKDD